MKRLFFSALQNWKEKSTRKPVLIRGARQVGKTWIVRELGRLFEDIFEVNFELYPQVKKIFHPDLDPGRITRDLSLLTGKKIFPGKTLIFFDEIQEEPKAIQSLRYFYEMLPEQHILAAGSLLDFELEKIGMPVGRISSLYLYPMSFLEFLKAHDEDLLVDLIIEKNDKSPIAEPVHQKLLDFLGIYMAVGGMPEAVKCWIETRDLQECTAIHRSIVDTYRQDFYKYARKFQVKYIDTLFDFVPTVLGRKFKYTEVPGNYRKRELMPALDLLLKAGVVHKIIHSAGRGIPLGGQSNTEIFKTIFLDIALAQAIMGLDASSWILEPTANFINKGEISEAFVGQELLVYSSADKRGQLYYWQREQRSSSAEIDYLIQCDHQIIPIEVKSGSPGTLKSLRLFLEQHKRSLYGIRFSGLNYAIDPQLHSYPLYAVANAVALDKDWGKSL